ncbi:hypothetical protein ACIP9H_33760 [Streptomyces sp. NPDC088732]|uniref:hypothetical protein n=1 Tax=Streptomyces sp. NPDC088732 TaxID=3365879 RepID=UPI003817A370
MSHLPTLTPADFGTGTCGREPAGGGTPCGAPATWHVGWLRNEEGGLRNSLACDAHMAEARDQFVYRGRHRVSADCGMPGTVWMTGRCGVLKAE